MKSTNYYNTFIAAAEDSRFSDARLPPEKKEGKTIARLQYEMITANPYRYTSDDILFRVYAIRNNVSENNYTEEREKFFSRSQACLRASPLTKQYGWGIHFDAEGRIALYARHSREYEKFLKDPRITVIRAMRLSNGSV